MNIISYLVINTLPVYAFKMSIVTNKEATTYVTSFRCVIIILHRNKIKKLIIGLFTQEKQFVTKVFIIYYLRAILILILACQ